MLFIFQALLTIVMHNFSRGNCGAFTNFPSFFMLHDEDHDKIGFILMGNFTAVPWPSLFSWYHQFSGKYFNLLKSFLSKRIWPRCSDGIPFPNVTYLQMSRSIITYREDDDGLLMADIIPEQNCLQASCSLSSVIRGLL